MRTLAFSRFVLRHFPFFRIKSQQMERDSSVEQRNACVKTDLDLEGWPDWSWELSQFGNSGALHLRTDRPSLFRQMASVTWSDPKRSTLYAITGSLLCFEWLLAGYYGFPFLPKNPQLLCDLISMLIQKRTYTWLNTMSFIKETKNLFLVHCWVI